VWGYRQMSHGIERNKLTRAAETLRHKIRGVREYEVLSKLEERTNLSRKNTLGIED